MSFVQNHDGKFDLQLSQALIDERRLADIFVGATLEKIELKSESWLWEQSGNICIEYRRNGKLTGISTTEADVWVHELKRNGQTLVYLMFPIERLKTLCRDAMRAGRVRKGVGDDNLSDVVILRLKDILQ
jgi:hypothetical protein